MSNFVSIPVCSDPTARPLVVVRVEEDNVRFECGPVGDPAKTFRFSALIEVIREHVSAREDFKQDTGLGFEFWYAGPGYVFVFLSTREVLPGACVMVSLLDFLRALKTLGVI